MNYLSLAKMICENLPEASMSMTCTGWDYEDGVFDFIDEVTGKKHSVTYEQVEKALPVFFEHLNKRWFFEYVEVPKSEDDFEDVACNMDAAVVDSIIQLVIFGDIIYS